LVTKGTVCCKSALSYCGCGFGSCNSSSVSACSPDPEACYSGEVKVTSCSQKQTSSGGSSNQCSPNIGADCDSSSQCKCGGACLKTSNCSTCTSRCEFPCETDQDCIDISEANNHSAPFTHCRSGSGLFKTCE
jgi:hypothetical protein